MNHDEAIEVLKDCRNVPFSRLLQAIDYAIAYMEPKPTQFGFRIVDALTLVPHNGIVADLLRDMQAHIQKLEKGQSDDKR